jgi:predicted glycoside hydrolase/deacetylase ChbG (UPF0249 family)
VIGDVRRLIVNADDFGRSRGINRGIACAHERGIVTSATLMVRWAAAAEAAAYARSNPRLSVGLHFDLTEWRYVGRWEPVYEVVPDGERESVEAELERQLETFTSLMGRSPTHLDSHQHVHRTEPVRSALVAAGASLGVPVRDCTPGIVYRGEFYGQSAKGDPFPNGIALGSLLRMISSLPYGVTELGCHPAIEPETDSSYAIERPRELAILCDPRVRAALTGVGVELLSFAELGTLWP